MPDLRMFRRILLPLLSAVLFFSAAGSPPQARAAAPRHPDAACTTPGCLYLPIAIGAPYRPQPFAFSEDWYDPPTLTFPPVSRDLEDVFSGDFNGDGRVDVGVYTDLDDSGTWQGTAWIAWGQGPLRFSPPVMVTQIAGTWIDLVVTGDVNGDGVDDLIIGQRSPRRLLLQLGVRGGLPAAPVTVAENVEPQEILAGDLNGDGDLDLIVDTWGTPAVVVLYGDGAGGFAEAQTAGMPDSFPDHVSNVALGDVDGDGRQDIVVMTEEMGYIFFGAQGEELQPGPTIAWKPSLGCDDCIDVVRATVADFNGDGRADLVVSIRWFVWETDTRGSELQVRLSTGRGGFASPRTMDAPDSASWYAAHDMNGDTHMDLLVSQLSTIAVLFGDGAGGLSSPQAVARNGSTTSVRPGAIADYSGDGFPDLPILDRRKARLTFVLNDRAGHFLLPQFDGDGPDQWDIGSLNALLAADFTADGHLDILALNSLEFAMIPGYGTGAFATPALYPVHSHISQGSLRSAAAGDLSGDGRPDLLLYRSINPDPDTFMVYHNDGAGGLALVQELAVGDFLSNLRVVDLNGDPYLDALATSRDIFFDNQMIKLFFADSAGRLSPGPEIRLAGDLGPRGFDYGDINGDGAADLLVSYSSPPEDARAAAVFGYAVLFGNGTGSFSQPIYQDTGDIEGSTLVLGRFNDDPHPDFVLRSYDQLYVYLGNGSGGFAPSGHPPLEISYDGLNVGDLSGDGFSDIAFLRARFPSEIHAYIADGSGGFQPPAAIPVDTSGDMLLLADFNEDSVLDLVVGPSPNQDEFTLLLSPKR